MQNNQSIMQISENKDGSAKVLFRIRKAEMTDVDTILESIGRRRGCLVSGGIVDFDKARRIILQDYRNTKLGTITLDQVDEEPYYSTDGEESHNG